MYLMLYPSRRTSAEEREHRRAASPGHAVPLIPSTRLSRRSRLLRSQPDADERAATCAGSASGDLAEVVAVVENDPHAGAQRPGIPAQCRDLVDVEVAVLDLAYPAR